MELKSLILHITIFLLINFLEQLMNFNKVTFTFVET